MYRWPNLTLWITEYALPNNDLELTQQFFKQSAEYFDSLDYVTHYSYFGSFRSDKSNVGPNVAMLDSEGELTSIGSWVCLTYSCDLIIFAFYRFLRCYEVVQVEFV